jgi:hypothetical protein
VVAAPTAQKPAKAPDTRVVTSLRIEPDLLLGLKAVALRKRIRVNELIIQAIRNQLALEGQAA